MISFRVAALALPAAAAFLAPALWAWRPGWRAVTLGHAALVTLVMAWGLIAGAPAAALVATLVMSTAFAMFALGLHLAAGQVVSGLAVVLLCSTLFLAPDAIVDANPATRKGDAQSRLDLFLSVNPWVVLAAGPFGLDVLRDFTSMYRTHLADWVEAQPPKWGGVAACYALTGVLLGAAAWGGRRRKQKPDDIPR